MYAVFKLDKGKGSLRMGHLNRNLSEMWGEVMPEIGSITFKDSETEIILGVTEE